MTRLGLGGFHDRRRSSPACRAGGFEPGRRCGLGFLRNSRMANHVKQCFTRSAKYFLLIAVLLIAVAMPIHESGHGLACMYLGLEILRFDLIDAKVNCTLVPGGPHFLSLLAGGGLAAALFSVPLALKQGEKGQACQTRAHHCDNGTGGKCLFGNADVRSIYCLWLGKLGDCCGGSSVIPDVPVRG